MQSSAAFICFNKHEKQSIQIVTRPILWHVSLFQYSDESVNQVFAILGIFKLYLNPSFLVDETNCNTQEKSFIKVA